jgi:ribosomal protein S13
MTPILRFLQSLRSLQKSGVIKSVDEAYDFAKREFGEINDLLKRQIEEIFNKPKGGITSIKREPKGEVIEASFKPGMDKRGRVVEESPSQASGIMSKIEESGKKLEGAANRMSEIQKEIDAMYKPKPDTSPLMERLEGGIETLKQMKQPGMDLTTGLTRTSVRKILDRAGIQVPDKVDPIEVFEKNFGGDALMDVKDVAEEMIELERMGKSTKSMDEILEQSGMFDIKRNPDAPKGLSDEEIERIKKEVDQEKKIKDFDPTDREPNSMGGFQRTNFAIGTKLIMGIINAIKKLKPMDAMKEMNEVVAKRGKYKNLDDDEVNQIFNETNDHIFERDVPADEFAVNFDDEVEKLSELAPKAAERFKLKQIYPGIDEDFLTKIIDDPDPQRKAEVLAALDQSMLLMKEGKTGDEVVDILKQETKGRKPNARGGLNYLMGM